MAASTQYELYWDDTAQQFMVSGKQNATTYNMETYATPVAIPTADMVTNNSWGLWGWSEAAGGSFNIDGTAMTTLATSLSTTKVVQETQDAVYPADHAALGGMQCIGDCPTAAQIALSNAVVPPAAYVSPYTNQGLGSPWGGAWNWDSLNMIWVVTGNTVPLANLVNYTFNATGNMVDAASAEVLNPTTNWVMSGKMFATADKAALDANKALVAGNVANEYSQSDLDLVSATGVPIPFYTWETSSNSWNQLSMLMDSNNAVVKFDAPLPVNFTVPANVAGTAKPYGNYAGAQMVLTYNGFGDLWGIPWTCIDLSTNLACNFAAAGSGMNANWSWKPEFSIAADGTNNFVTATVAPATTASTYWVKPLQEEVRFAKVADAACANGGLTLPGTAPGLPTATGFIAPALATAPVPANTAPRVIHGVVQY
jgi:hypothetical protein